jgi:ribosomal protein S18 acetylase RimI-like enzyme
MTVARATVERLSLRVIPAPSDDEGTWHLEASLEGETAGRAKFDLFPGHLLLLQISVSEAFRRRGIATAMLRHLATTYERPINVEDFFADGYALFGGRYTWKDD